MRGEELQRHAGERSSSRGPAGIKQVRPHRCEIQMKYYWKLVSVGTTETAIGQRGQTEQLWMVTVTDRHVAKRLPSADLSELCRARVGREADGACNSISPSWKYSQHHTMLSETQHSFQTQLALPHC